MVIQTLSYRISKKLFLETFIYCLFYLSRRPKGLGNSFWSNAKWHKKFDQNLFTILEIYMNGLRSEVYLEPCQIPVMELFQKIINSSYSQKGQSQIFRSSRTQLFFEVGVLKSFAIFTGKHLLWNFCSLYRTPPVAASRYLARSYILLITDSCCVVEIRNLNKFIFRRTTTKTTLMQYQRLKKEGTMETSVFISLHLMQFMCILVILPQYQAGNTQ